MSQVYIDDKEEKEIIQHNPLSFTVAGHFTVTVTKFNIITAVIRRGASVLVMHTLKTLKR